MVKAVLLDLDNTLYDEHRFVKSGFKPVSKVISKKFSLSEADVYQCLWQFFLTVKRKQVFSQTLLHFGVHADDIIPELVTVFRNHDPAISLFKGVHSTLLTLKKEFVLGLITDGKKEVQENKVKALKLHSYFNVITYADEYGGKCSPKPFTVTLEKLHVSPQDSVYVDDNPLNGLAVAKKLGIRTIRMMRGENKHITIDDEKNRPDSEISNLTQLEDIIRDLSLTSNNKLFMKT
jgi:putative hydrolase of the HAD superfamily